MIIRAARANGYGIKLADKPMIFSKTPQRPCITKTGRWVYTATTDVPTGTTVRPSTMLRTGIAVTASDRPGGIGSAEEEKAL